MSDEKWVYNGVEFKPGDRVKVVRIEESLALNGMGAGIQWANVWIDREQGDGGVIDRGMDGAIGHEFTINHIDEAGAVFVDFVDHGYELDFKPAMYAYPLSVLEKMPPTAQ